MNIEIKTKRLVIKKPQIRDKQKLISELNNKEVSKWLENVTLLVTHLPSLRNQPLQCGLTFPHQGCTHSASWPLQHTYPQQKFCEALFPAILNIDSDPNWT